MGLADRVNVLSAPPLAVAALLLCACASGTDRFAYQNGEIDAFLLRPGALRLTFDTQDGPRSAYYLPLGTDPAHPPAPLVLVFPGVNSRALDFAPYFDGVENRDAGVLFVEYPGRGGNGGSLRPGQMAATARRAMGELAHRLGAPRESLAVDLRLLGHSLGTAGALNFARAEPGVTHIVLAAPMTTVKDAVWSRYGPLAWLLPGADRLDNRAALDELGGRDPRPDVTILHGDADPVLPVAMGRELAALHPWTAYVEVPGGDHVSILESEKGRIRGLLFGGP